MTASAEPHRLSVSRLLLVILVAGGLAAAASFWLLGLAQRSNAGASRTWTVPYVDVTLTPIHHFEEPTDDPARNVALAFVVADPAASCQPSWGGYYSLDAAARALDLDRRIARLRERGGDVVVSFGGALNGELATACRDTDALAAAYQAVIDRYNLTAIEFDIEGAALGDQAANRRRAEAIARLQAKTQALDVWFTLPVATSGLTPEGLALVRVALDAGVTIDGVNVMTMNYGGSRPANMSMREANESALTATWQQVGGLFIELGHPKTDAELWAMLGATPMIGQNDVAEDVFTTGDAQSLVDFARNVGLGRLSFWSANRDVSCGPVVGGKGVSNTCSGVNQDVMEFSRILGGGAARTAPADADSGDSGERNGGATRDDPRTSPYPIWRTSKAYEEGAKVVWQGRVYQAKWWSQNNQPDAPVKHVWDTPWRYLGPVLESDRVAVRAEAPSNGARMRWSAENVFVAGDEVEYQGKAFRAKWWTQGDVPREDPDQPYDHPWEFIGDVPK